MSNNFSFAINTAVACGTAVLICSNPATAAISVLAGSLGSRTIQMLIDKCMPDASANILGKMANIASYFFITTAASISLGASMSFSAVALTFVAPLVIPITVALAGCVLVACNIHRIGQLAADRLS